jgi:predicted nucleotidyltransferase
MGVPSMAKISGGRLKFFVASNPFAGGLTMTVKLKKIAFELAANLSDYPLRYIVLFGSVARGDVHLESDLDLFLVFDTDTKPGEYLLKEINDLADDIAMKYDISIDLVFSNRNYDGFDPYFIQKVFSEGTLLYARSPKVELNNVQVRAFTFITYRLDSISPLDRKQLSARLYGKSTHDESTGEVSHRLLKRLGGTKLGDNVLMLPTQNLGPVKTLLEEYGVLYSEVEAWLFV